MTKRKNPEMRPFPVEESDKSHDSFSSCSVVKPLEWPHYDAIKLNPTQMAALQYVMSNQVTLIQGPPGTGKTFIAVKLVHLLLKT